MNLSRGGPRYYNEVYDDAPPPRKRRSGRSGGNNGGRRGGGGNNHGGGKKPNGRGFWGNIGYWFAVFSLWAAVAMVGVFIWVASDLPDPEALWKKTDRPSITYVDIHGQIIERRGAADAPPVDLKSIPDYVPKAVMAIEDRKFYQHWGFDFFGLARAMFIDLRAGHVVQGGSTITQQLAKNLFLSSEQTIKRKAQELLLSVWLESRFTKDQIMALYLARVYFGAGAYGINEASQRYFNKSPSQLTISEAALLAGLLKAPSKYSPISSTERAAERATVVLDVMEQEHVITHEQRLAAVSQPLKFVPNSRGSNVGYFLDWVDPMVGAQIGEPTEDIIVETTLDARQQSAAEKAISDEVDAEGKPLRFSQAALIAMSGDGGVRAMVGGKSYNESEFNRITDAKRQPGSAFKPFVYLAAMERGETPYSVKIDQPIKIGNWAPQNYENSYGGPMTLLNAFAHSVNTVAVQLCEEDGRDAVIRVARRLGIKTRIDPDATMALGTQVVIPLEITTAFVPFSNGGASVTPYGIKCIRTRSGKILYERETPQPRRVIDETVLRNMNLLFRQVVLSGTGRAAALSNYMVGGKTGTTSDYADAWFIGFTGGYTAGVWVGNDDYQKKMNKVVGGNVPAKIWHNFMTAALAGSPKHDFLLPTEPGPPPDQIIGPEDVNTTTQAIDSPAVINNGNQINSNVPPAPPATPNTPVVAPQNHKAETRTLDQIIKDAQKNNDDLNK